MFRVELDDRDGVEDVVAVLADFRKAEVRMVRFAETADADLATALSALMRKNLIEVRQAEEPREAEIAELIGRLDEVAAAVPRSLEVLQPVDAEMARDIARFGKCEFCEKAARPRGTICGSDECKRAQGKKHNATYNAKRKNGQVEEVAASASPFVGSRPERMRIMGQPEEEYPMEWILFLAQTGMLEEGQQVQDVDSLTLYSVLGGELVAVDQDGRSLSVPGPGRGENPPGI